jgi:hypothetical protein
MNVDTISPKNYAAAWADLRLRRWSFYGVIFGFPLLWGAIRYFVPWVASSESILASVANSPWPALAYVFLWIALGFYLRTFHCPRCHKRFFSGQANIVFFQHKCTHCGLSDSTSTADAKIETEAVPFFRRRLVVFFFFLILLFVLHGLASHKPG